MGLPRPEMYAIDFGTSNSLLAAASRRDVFDCIALDSHAEEASVLRSILYFTPDGQIFFGAQALREYVERGMDGRLLRSLKRFLPFRSFRSTYIGNRRYRLEELIASLLRSMRERADQHFGCEVRRVLLGRPARYAESEEDDSYAEERMREAALLAGFEHVEFCAEPTAAARDFTDVLKNEQTILVADFGGGTSDFSVVRMSQSAFSHDDVLATAGVSIAGDALDGALMKRHLSHLFGGQVRYTAGFGKNQLPMPAELLDMLCTPAKLPLLQSPRVIESLKEIMRGCAAAADREAIERFLCVIDDALGFQVFESVERTKRELSSAEETTFRFDYPDMDLRMPTSRKHFNAACESQTVAIMASLDQAVARAKLKHTDIDLICLTGGTSRVPMIHDALVKRFGAERLRRLKGLHSVVGGLAHEARRRLAS